jgi:hypothetical protein
MLQERIYKEVAKATVTLSGKGGQGVLVNNNLIITAAHCINFSCEGEMAFGNDFMEEIKTGERKLKVAPLAVEPVSDIAVLGSLDNQSFSKEAEDFERFCEHTKPVPLCQNDFVLFQKFRVHIYTHKGTWVTGSATQTHEDAQKLGVEADEQIEDGTSGGPIINDSGELVGIVSFFTTISEAQPKSIGSAPRPNLALPVWACREIFRPDLIENDEEGLQNLKNDLQKWADHKGSKPVSKT